MKEQNISKKVSAKEGMSYLKVKEGGCVHSIQLWGPGLLAGCDLESDRVKEILEDSEQKGRLYLTSTLSGHLHHELQGWDEKSKMYIYLECSDENLKHLQ